MLKVLIIGGGQSNEHEISCISASNIMKNIDMDKYDVTGAYIDRNGRFYECHICSGENRDLTLIENVIEFLQKYDVVWPVLHGQFGEDGIIQGLLEMAGVKYVGCKILASAVGMDKEICKIIAEANGIPVVPYNKLKKGDMISDDIKLPVIVKPANSGSSIGITKVDFESEMKEAMDNAFKHDDKILVEEFIVARELECAALGNEDYFISDPGEIIPANEFYDYDAKYNSKESMCIVPAKIDTKAAEEIKKYAKTLCEAIGVRGLARVDFLLSKDDSKIYFNEINTMPGFTDISMYPKMMEHSDVKYPDLIDKLIQLALV